MRDVRDILRDEKFRRMLPSPGSRVFLADEVYRPWGTGVAGRTGTVLYSSGTLYVVALDQDLRHVEKSDAAGLNRELHWYDSDIGADVDATFEHAFAEVLPV